MTERRGQRRVNLVYLSLLAVLIGVATGYGAVGFRGLIALIHNVGFSGVFSFVYDANEFTPPSYLGIWIVLVPIGGALIVTFLVKNFAPEAKGHGVPEVMDAIYYRGGAIRPVVVVVKSIASAISIGTGGAVGREGPIVQIGAAFASSVGGWLGLAPWQRITLVAAGAGGGIAATFNTPLGAVLFAAELMLPEVSVRTFLPVALATATATFVGRLYFGYQPSFALPTDLPGLGSISLESMLAFAGLGLVMGFAATLYIRAIYWSEDFFDKRIGNDYLRHVIGMALVGAIFTTLMMNFGHYFVEGVGYATIQSILDGHQTLGWMLLLLFAAKLCVTSITLGSGASGGIFSPALFLGATLGGAYGALVEPLLPSGGSNIATFAMIGMAAMVGSATGAVLTAIIMIFEMTLNYDIVLPMVAAVALSVGIRRLLSTENIYTLKLARRGRGLPKSLHANMFLVRTSGDVMDERVTILRSDMSYEDFVRMHPGLTGYVVVRTGRHVSGLFEVSAAMHTVESMKSSGSVMGPVAIGQLAHRDFTIARRDDVMFDVIIRMSRKRVDNVLVVGGDQRIPGAGDVVGVVTKDRIAESVGESLTYRSERR